MIDRPGCRVAGVTVAQQVAAERRPDRISIGVPARTFADEMVNYLKAFETGRTRITKCTKYIRSRTMIR